MLDEVKPITLDNLQMAAATGIGVPQVSDGTDGTQMSNEKTIQQQAKKIFAYLLQLSQTMSAEEFKDRTISRSRLIREYNGENPFKNQYAIYYELCVNFPKIDFTDSFLLLYLQQNQAKIKADGRIDLKPYEVTSDTPYNAFVEECVATLKEMQSTILTEVDFETALETYKMLYLSERSITVLETGVQVLTDGKTLKGRKMYGYTGMREYIASEFLKLDNVVQQKKTRGVVCYGITPEEDEEKNKNLPLGKLGLPGLDDYYVCYEGDMINLMGAAKAGKSRACVQVLHNMLVENGQNCLIWSLENGFDGWERMFRVKHFNYMYNKTVGSVVQKKILTEDMLKSGEMPTEIRDLELASWEQFKFNAEYGKLSNVEEPLCYDTFLDILEAAVNKNNIKMICIDYLGLMDRGRGARDMETNALVADVYKKMLQFLKTHKIAGIFPTHLKQEVTDHFGTMTNADLENADLRTAAGLSYEVVKTPDLNLALVATKADIATGYARLVHVPSRVAPFPLTEMQVDLGSCTFVAKNNIK